MRKTIALGCALGTLLAAGPVAAQTCGNFVREVPEQCDDGNLRNLDGCDAGCRFEHTQRINNLQLQFATALTCTNNALGGAILPLARNTVQSAITTGVADGSLSILFHVLGLDDPAGNTDPSLEVGPLNAVRFVTGSTAYNGNTSSDWWYGLNAADLLADRTPIDRLTGSLAGQVLTAGPGSADIGIVLGGQPAVLSFSSLVLNMTTGAATMPPASTGLPPGHEAIEHLDPTLQTFASTGAPSDPNWGTMCGNASATSLTQIPFPSTLIPLCTGQGYTAANSFLDLLVGGCSSGPLNLIAATQPDQSDPGAPAAGAGAPYTLMAPPPSRVVTGCRDQLNADVPLAACLDAAAYSGFFKFTTHRVVGLDDAIFADDFDSGTLAAWSAVAIDGGDLSVGPGIVGAGGLVGVVDDQAGLFVQDDEPEDESRYRASFQFDPSAFDPGEANGKFRTRLFLAFEESPNRRVMALVLRRIGGAYSLMARVRQDDNTQENTSFFPLTAEPHRVDFEWIRSSGPDANDGTLRLWLDGALVATLGAQDNSISSIDFVRLGALSVKQGATGTLRWDEFQSTRRAPLP